MEVLPVSAAMGGNCTTRRQASLEETIQGTRTPSSQSWFHHTGLECSRQEHPKSQDAGQYLVLDLEVIEILDGVTCSPFGAVAKGSVDMHIDARMIHDLSFPNGDSVNEDTVPGDAIEITYEGAAVIAQRLVTLRKEGLDCKMMTGDVNTAFRNIPIHADHVIRFAGTIPELVILIIDLCCPFGRTDSPGYYWVAGAAIKHLYEMLSSEWPDQPPFGSDNFSSAAWCDDYMCADPGIGTRFAEADLALRSAMIYVLGPRACNEDKFSQWFKSGKALGLEWSLVDQTLSIPLENVEKARVRVGQLLSSSHTTRHQLDKLLGSLRHVVTCIRPATAFFQRIASLRRLSHRYSRIEVTEDVREDLRWFPIILTIAPLNAIRFDRFVDRVDPDYIVLMDASDSGICAAFPARKEFLQIQFDPEERWSIASSNESFDINVRELLSAVFAAVVWGKTWRSTDSQPCHVRFNIDNQSAVCWSNTRGSRKVSAQLLLRVLALMEVQHNFDTSARHVPGVDNVLADAGSVSTKRIEEALAALGALLRAGALAQTSSKKYDSAWHQWEEWCGMMGYSVCLDRDTVDKKCHSAGGVCYIFVAIWYESATPRSGTQETSYHGAATSGDSIEAESRSAPPPIAMGWSNETIERRGRQIGHQSAGSMALQRLRGIPRADSRGRARHFKFDVLAADMVTRMNSTDSSFGTVASTGHGLEHLHSPSLTMRIMAFGS
ncbi:hypothetical protein ON010_g9603 [Phytophthora cinnamomi]|nr:hypothetical protein ON010_g9603 [Phytophthora cinnamomi]